MKSELENIKNLKTTDTLIFSNTPLGSEPPTNVQILNELKNTNVHLNIMTAKLNTLINVLLSGTWSEEQQ